MTLWMRPRRNDETDKATWPDLSGPPTVPS